MFDLRKIPMLRVMAPFCAGMVISFQFHHEILFRDLCILAISLWMGAVMTFLFQRMKPLVMPWLLSPILYLLFFVVGMGTAMHTKALDPGLPVDSQVLVRGEVTGQPKAHSYAYTFDLKVDLLSSSDTLCHTATNLKCYMSMIHDSLLPASGEIWHLRGRLTSIKNNGNPGSPDYKTIMGRKDFWYRLYISAEAEGSSFNRKVRIRKKNPDPQLIRRAISDPWQGDREELSLLKAVCLGDRSWLTDDMRQAYSHAGGMHLLAVSGLHVGLIWWILHYLTSWMPLIFRNGKPQMILIVALLWFYAFVTGFSSSVCRSVTMFSFFSVSRMMGERAPPLNTLFVSAFVLLLIDPPRLMDVGFQLSYSAMIGIITLHPIAIRRFRPKNRVLRWAWELSSLSLAAQLATAPLVIYYFNQFPVYSIITSLIAVPLLSMLIAIFVCSIPFILSGVLLDFSSVLLVGIARLLNQSMELIASLPGAVLDGLQLTRPGLLLWIFLLLSCMLSLYSKSRTPRYFVLLFICACILLNSLKCIDRRSSSEIVIANIRRASMLSIRTGRQVDHYCWCRDSVALEYMKNYQELAWSKRYYESQEYDMFLEGSVYEGASGCVSLGEGVWMLGGDGFNALVLRAPIDVFALDSIVCPDLILLSGEPAVDWPRKNKFLQQGLLVIDGSNGKWYKERMLAEWDQVYLTDKSGAYVKRW